MIIHVKVFQDAPGSVSKEIVHVSGGPCLAPASFTVGHGTEMERRVQVACGRRLPRDQQCRNCRHRVFVDDGSGTISELNGVQDF